MTIASDYFVGCPDSWASLPSKIVLSYSLSEGRGVTRDFFSYFERDSFAEVVKTLYADRYDGCLLAYSLICSDKVPFLAWNIDSSFSKLINEKYYRRRKGCHSYPQSVGEEFDSNHYLLTLYQYLPGIGFSGLPPVYGNPTVRLRVAGRSKNEAYANWVSCAQFLKKLRP